MSATLSLIFGVAACLGTVLATVRVEVVGAVGVVLLGVSMIGLVAVQRRAGTAGCAFERGLATMIVGSTTTASASVSPPRWHAWIPFWFDHRGVEVIRNLSYGEHGRRSRLDVYRPVGTTVDPPGGAAEALPVLIYIHGGAWVIGNKDQQGKPLLLHLSRSGYIGVSINYRLAPRHRWPAQIIDVKGRSCGSENTSPSMGATRRSSPYPAHQRAATLRHWPRSRQAIRCSNRASKQPMRRSTPVCRSMGRSISRIVPDCVAASPLFRVNTQAPPMFVIQGQLDALVWREEAREFVAALGQCTNAPLVFVEVPGAQHAFEVFNSVRCRAAIDTICRFLDVVRHPSLE